MLRRDPLRDPGEVDGRIKDLLDVSERGGMFDMICADEQNNWICVVGQTDN